MFIVGGSPYAFNEWNDNCYTTVYNVLDNDATNRHVAAIGECGISEPIDDPHEKLPPLDKQIKFFRYQVYFYY